MTIAELRGKISSLGANVTDTSEDLLTSDVFGCIRYVPPERGLVQFLETARTLSRHGFCTPRGKVILSNNMQAYIFCHPDYYDEMKRLATDGTLDRVSGEAEHGGRRPNQHITALILMHRPGGSRKTKLLEGNQL